MGGEDGENQQNMRRIEAESYDYENDPRWAEYWSNVLIPPHMASRDNVVDHFKRKFYQRYIDPELIVEPMGGKSSASSSGSSSTPPRSASPPNYGSSGRTQGASSSTSSPASSASLQWDQRMIQFCVNAWVFFVGLLAILPFTPVSLSNRAYRLSLLGTLCSSLYSLYSLYGKPRAWNLQALQVWFQSIASTKDFIYSIYCIIFVTSNLCLKFALIPVLCHAVEHVAFLRRNFGRSNLYRRYLEEACVWIESNTATLTILSSQAEIGMGFLMIISLFSWQRNILQSIMYWQLLKLMYNAPATAGYHRNTWTNIGRFVDPLIQRYAPFLNSPIAMAQTWWFR